MSRKKSVDLMLLSSLLRALVDAWGFDAVRAQLDKINKSSSSQADALDSESINGDRFYNPGVKPDKPTASEMASKLSLPAAQKNLIQMLAVKYDDKQFLPTSGDIRYFFEVHGEEAPSTKKRSEAFRKVLKVLSATTESALRKMIDDGAHSGPSRLGPLSEAMRGFGEARSGGVGSATESNDEVDGESEVSSEKPSGN